MAAILTIVVSLYIVWFWWNLVCICEY